MPEITINFDELPDDHPVFVDYKRTVDERVARLMKTLPSRGPVPVDYFEYGPFVRNAELFNAIADELELFPESYDQDVWGTRLEEHADETLCGTAFCIAGHGVHRTGWDTPVHDWFMVKHPNHPDAGNINTSKQAAYELGLNGHESSELFDSDWLPEHGYTVSDALRALANGADIEDVTREDDPDDNY